MLAPPSVVRALRARASTSFDNNFVSFVQFFFISFFSFVNG